MPEFPRLFLDAVKKPVFKDVLLSGHSTFKIGGPADYFFEPVSIEDLKSVLQVSRRTGMPRFIVGEGSNILFDDEGFRGLIIKNKVKGIMIRRESAELEAFSGNRLMDVVTAAGNAGLEGIEFLAGIPGTVGGAVFGNAGAFGRSTADVLRRAILLDDQGREFEAGNDYFSFSYRRSCLKTKQEIVIKIVLGLRSGDSKKIKTSILDILDQRRKKHPSWSVPSAGSYFKNPVKPDGSRLAAGCLLEEVGAKDIAVGGAAVYHGHANFIINRGGASASDVLALARMLKEKVKDKFGIELEEEVIFLPATAARP